MTRIDRLNEVLRAYDRDLFVNKIPSGMLQIHRKVNKSKVTRFNEDEIDPGYLHPQFILALTHNWLLTGEPVDWGIEPIMETLRSMDQWNHDDFNEMIETRDRKERDRLRSQNSEFRAIAADLRKDYARATNDINVSNL